MARRDPALPVPEFSRWSRGRTGFRRERALARRDGLWISAGALRIALRVPDEKNAAVVLMAAIGRVGKGPPTAQEGILMGRLPLDVWREASERPSLVFDRHWEKPFEVLRPELASFKGAGKVLVERARSESEPLEDLSTVARLAALTAQEPEMICQTISLALGKMALRAATERGLAHKVEALLGSPSLRYGLSTMALGLPPALRPRWRFIPRGHLALANSLGRGGAESSLRSGTMAPVPSWYRRMAPRAADRFQARTLRMCRRLYRGLGSVDASPNFRRMLWMLRVHWSLYPFTFFPMDWAKAEPMLEAFAAYEELRRIARER